MMQQAMQNDAAGAAAAAGAGAGATVAERATDPVRACADAYAGSDGSADGPPDGPADGFCPCAHELPGAQSDAHAVLHGNAERTPAAGGGPEGRGVPRELDAEGLAQAPAPEQAAG